MCKTLFLLILCLLTSISYGIDDTTDREDAAEAQRQEDLAITIIDGVRYQNFQIKNWNYYNKYNHLFLNGPTFSWVQPVHEVDWPAAKLTNPDAGSYWKEHNEYQFPGYNNYVVPIKDGMLVFDPKTWNYKWPANLAKLHKMPNAIPHSVRTVLPLPEGTTRVQIVFEWKTDVVAGATAPKLNFAMSPAIVDMGLKTDTKPKEYYRYKNNDSFVTYGRSGFVWDVNIVPYTWTTKTLTAWVDTNRIYHLSIPTSQASTIGYIRNLKLYVDGVGEEPVYPKQKGDSVIEPVKEWDFSIHTPDGPSNKWRLLKIDNGNMIWLALGSAKTQHSYIKAFYWKGLSERDIKWIKAARNYPVRIITLKNGEKFHGRTMDKYVDGVKVMKTDGTTSKVLWTDLHPATKASILAEKK